MLVVMILFGYFLYLKLLIYFDIHFTIFVSRLGYTFCYKLYSFKNVYQFLQYGTYMVYNFIQILLRNFRPCVYSMPSLVISLERLFAVCLSVFKHRRSILFSAANLNPGIREDLVLKKWFSDISQKSGL